MMDVDYQMAQQLQAKEQEQLSIKEKSKLFIQLLKARKKHFAEMRAREKRNKPPTQAQQRKLYYNYLKNMEGYTRKQLKGFKFEVIKDMFDKAFKRLEQEVAKKQKIDDAKVDDDHEEARMKKLMNIVPDEEEVAIDAIPLATFIHMFRNFDREDLETLWKLVKAKHGSTRLEEGYERSILSEVAIYAYLYAGREKVDPLNPPLPVSELEPEDTIEVENPIEHKDETVPASIHEVGELSTAPFLREDSDGLLPGLMRKAKDEYYGKLILDLGNKVRSSVEQGTTAMEKLVEKLGNAEDKVKCKKLKKELEEARYSNTFLRMQNERVERDLYWTRVRAHEFYQEMISREFVFEERPNKAIDVPIEDEKIPSSEPRGSPHDA
ncbi:hypothetical protein Tco_1082428 [Tanacetum coccineum]|uniref:Uncharacterized protein n=1 Tax=Tanacetum coccineum TaxID=301880 RepID=A0ABQ5I0K7_9ASTR